jgi:selenide,water dikinase
MIHALYDPQTAGGLLIAIAEDRAEDLLASLRENYPQASIIGRVKDKLEHSLIIL